MLIKVLALYFLSQSFCYAHDIQYEVSNNSSVVIDCYFSEGQRFSYENVEIYSPGEKIPFQVGRTDQHGRFGFLPDHPGKWTIKVFSEDGHGVNFTIEIDEDGTITNTKKSLSVKYLKIITGLGIILGIFGFISLFYRKKKTNKGEEDEKVDPAH